jgi:succinate-semialdehyde dehydrogenase/glutarate-semialdehyde dehydrogenase
MDVPEPHRLRLREQAGFVDGRWIGADSGATLDVTCPADGTVLGVVPNMGAAETVRAIAAAERALPAWSALTAHRRSSLLRKWFDLVVGQREALARMLTAEQGKPLAEARAEIDYGASFIDWFSEEAKRIYGDIIASPRPGGRILVQKEPVGVVAAITPWNFPCAMITRKCAAALAAGCTVVVKPSELTPFTALALARLAQEAGIPDGVFNVVTGDAAAIGAAMTGSRIVRKISFTGSTRVGRLLLEQSAPSIKRTSLELGGNAPLIVFDDADLDLAVQGAVTAKFRNAGQTCVCANRIFVQAGIYDAFSRALVARVDALPVGRGDDEATAIGPLINEAAVAKVERHVADALAKGATLMTGGERHALGGNFYRPTVIADADESMQLAQDETFGPVAPLFRFTSESEVIAAANDTDYGLAAYLFTRDLNRVFRVTQAIQTGMIAVNEGVLSNEVAPFGGIKQSGLGREGSKYGIDEYLNIKYVLIANTAA